MKSNERREEVERLNLIMKGLRARISKNDETKKTIAHQDKQLELLRRDMQQAQLTITNQQSVMRGIAEKKNAFLDGPKPYKHRFSSKVIQSAIDLFKCGLGYKSNCKCFQSISVLILKKNVLIQLFDNGR